MFLNLTIIRGHNLIECVSASAISENKRCVTIMSVNHKGCWYNFSLV